MKFHITIASILILLGSKPIFAQIVSQNRSHGPTLDSNFEIHKRLNSTFILSTIVSKPRQILSYNWVNNSWVSTGKNTRLYDSRGRVLVSTNLNTANDTLSRLKYNYSNLLPDTNLTTRIFQNYRNTNWIDSTRQISKIFPYENSLMYTRAIFRNGQWSIYESYQDRLGSIRQPLNSINIGYSTSNPSVITYKQNSYYIYNSRNQLQKATYSIGYPNSTAIDSNITFYRYNNPIQFCHDKEERYEIIPNNQLRPTERNYYILNTCDSTNLYKNKYDRVTNVTFSNGFVQDSVINYPGIVSPNYQEDIYEYWRNNGTADKRKFINETCNIGGIPGGRQRTQVWNGAEWQNAVQSSGTVDTTSAQQGNPIYTNFIQEYWRNGSWVVYKHTKNNLTYAGINLMEHIVQELDTATNIFRNMRRYVYSNHQTFNLPTQTTENKPKNSSNTLKIYPNPAKNSINVEVKNAVSIEIVDVLGKIVLSQNTLSDKQIDVSSLDKGIYFVKIMANNFSSFGGSRDGFEFLTGKFIKE